MIQIKVSKKSVSDIRHVIEEVAKFDSSNVKGLDQLQTVQEDVFYNPVTEEIYGYNYQAALAVANDMILTNSGNEVAKVTNFIQKIADNSFGSDAKMMVAGRENGGNAFYYNYVVNVDQFAINPKYIWKATFNSKNIKYTRYEIIEKTDTFAVGKPAKGKKIMFDLSNANTVIKNTAFSMSLLELVETILAYIDSKVNEGIKTSELLKLTNVLSYIFVNMTGGLHKIVQSKYEEDLRNFMSDIFIRAQIIFEDEQQAVEKKAADKAAKLKEREEAKAAKAAEKKAKEEAKDAKKAEELKEASKVIANGITMIQKQEEEAAVLSKDKAAHDNGELPEDFQFENYDYMSDPQTKLNEEYDQSFWAGLRADR